MKLPNMPRAARIFLQIFNVRVVHAHRLQDLTDLEDSMVKLKEFHADADAGGTKLLAHFREDPAASLHMAAGFANMVAGCENYREVSFTPSRAAMTKLGCHFVTVTVQKHGRSTPHQLREDAMQALGRLQLAINQAAQPFVGPLEWLGPQCPETGVRDTDTLLSGSKGRITIGDLRRVVDLLKNPGANTAVRAIDAETEKMLAAQVVDSIQSLEHLKRELRRPWKRAERHYLIELVNMAGARLNTAARCILGDKAPVYDPQK